MKIKFQISGMTCAACSARVEKVSAAVHGVEKAEVNLLKGYLKIQLKGDIETNLQLFHVSDVKILKSASVKYDENEYLYWISRNILRGHLKLFYQKTNNNRSTNHKHHSPMLFELAVP